MVPVILGIFAVLTGSGLLAGDEESGKLDLVMAHPISRTGLFVGRLLSAELATLAILAIVWLGFLTSMSWSSLSIDALALTRPLLSLWAVLIVFLTLGLLLSLVLPSRGAAASLAGLLLVASYFVTSMARIKDGLKGLAHFSPLNYYQTDTAFKSLNLTWFGGLLLAALVLALLAWLQFERRDIRVGGEAGWKLPSLRLWRRRTAG
jgi:ABC-2 type transport system permease protein